MRIWTAETRTVALGICFKNIFDVAGTLTSSPTPNCRRKVGEPRSDVTNQLRCYPPARHPADKPYSRVIFDRVGGPELGRIENIIGEDEHGNLTLTFGFGLTKDGIAENTDAERAHFAPMEGAYMGAVAATLGAVRRTVVEQGRDKIAPASPDDVSGNNKWIYDFFKVVDSLQMEPFLQLFTDDVQLTFGNHPTSTG